MAAQENEDEPGSPSSEVLSGLTDAELVAGLRRDGCTGVRWALARERLAGYAIGTLQRMFLDGTLIWHTTSLGRPVRFTEAEGADLRSNADDRANLVHEAVYQGLVLVHDEAVLGRKWDPARGASLSTYAVNACLLTLPNIARAWRTARKAVPPTASLDSADIRAAIDADSRRAQPDIADRMVTAAEFEAEIARMHPDLQRAARLRCTTEQSWAEIAQALGLSPRVLEGLMHRHRKKYRRGTEEGQ